MQIQELRTRRLIAAAMAVLVAAPSGFGAPEQQQPSQPTAATAQPVATLPTVQSLKVVAMAGKEERNDLKTGVMAPLVVQVLDQNLRPVEGAQVVFRFPLSGPSAYFPGNKNSQTTSTNADGQAAATGWIANRQVGHFEVRVNASRRNETGEAIIGMWNVASVAPDEKVRAKHWYSSKWGKIAIIAGAGAGIAAGILLTRGGGGNGSGSNGTVTGTPGTPTVGGPR